MTSFIMNSILVFFVLVITIGMAYSKRKDQDSNDLKESRENKKARGNRLERNVQHSELSLSLRDNPAIHCEWGQWQLGTCSEDCGAGTQVNTRSKLIEEANGGTCEGQAEETVECMIVECPSCVDTALGITDYYEDGCDYYEDYPNDCGEWDTDEFTANLMCCACEKTDGDTTDVPTEAPGLELCFDVTTHTTDWGNENDWTIGCKGECIGCANDPEFGNHAKYSQQCCMPQNETEFTITCMDEWGDGWHGGFLVINGTQYCEDFSKGYEYQDSMPREGGTEPEPDCNQCVSEFAENGGCDCMQNEACNFTALIPEGCYHCGDAANEYCAFDAEIGYPEYSGGVVIDA